MDIVKREQTIEDFDFNNAWVEISEQLELSWEERAENLKYGFSFGGSLKDIYKTYLQILSGQILDKSIHNIHEFSNIDPEKLINFLKAAKGDTSSLHTLTKNIANSEVHQYFTKQILTQLGEKSGQRHFKYSLNKMELVNMIQATANSYEIHQSERELVEMTNVLNLFLNTLDSEEELELYLQDRITLENFKFNSMNLEVGDSVIEFSPPIYEHQSDVMIRIYRFNGEGFNIDQYSLPFHDLNEVELAKKILLENGGEVFQSAETVNEKNSALAKIVKVKKGIDIDLLLNSFPQIQELGGTRKIDIDDEPKIEKLNKIYQIINPFIENTTNNISAIIFDQEKFRNSVEKYKDVMLLSTANATGEKVSKDTNLQASIESGEFLKHVVNGGNSGQYISEKTGGQSSTLDLSFQGDCDILQGKIGGENSASLKIGEMREVTSLTKQGDIELKLFETRTDKGDVIKVFACPVCSQMGSKTMVDICKDKCPSCSTSLQDMRINAEKGNLREFVQKTKNADYKSNINTENGNIIDSIINFLFGFTIG